ncbi:hypothetical protein Pelo_8748 [Pelomyxa schiedti]|nr:hypothetical protein Pelo_8748 [Pelomyxa schiedti]
MATTITAGLGWTGVVAYGSALVGCVYATAVVGCGRGRGREGGTTSSSSGTPRRGPNFKMLYAVMIDVFLALRCGLFVLHTVVSLSSDPSWWLLAFSLNRMCLGLFAATYVPICYWWFGTIRALSKLGDTLLYSDKILANYEMLGRQKRLFFYACVLGAFALHVVIVVWIVFTAPMKDWRWSAPFKEMARGVLLKTKEIFANQCYAFVQMDHVVIRVGLCFLLRSIMVLTIALHIYCVMWLFVLFGMIVPELLLTFLFVYGMTRHDTYFFFIGAALQVSEETPLLERVSKPPETTKPHIHNNTADPNISDPGDDDDDGDDDSEWDTRDDRGGTGKKPTKYPRVVLSLQDEYSSSSL